MTPYKELDFTSQYYSVFSGKSALVGYRVIHPCLDSTVKAKTLVELNFAKPHLFGFTV